MQAVKVLQQCKLIRVLHRNLLVFLFLSDRCEIAEPCIVWNALFMTLAGVLKFLLGNNFLIHSVYPKYTDSYKLIGLRGDSWGWKMWYSRSPGQLDSFQLQMLLYSLLYSLPKVPEYFVLVIFESNFQSDIQSVLSRFV